MFSRSFLFAVALTGSLVGCRAAADSPSQAAPAQPATATASADFSIEGMACERCSARLDDVIGKLDGVASVTVDFKSERMHVDYDGTAISTSDIVAAVERAGFEAHEVKQ